MNSFAKKTKNQNLLKSKVKGFQQAYNQSQKRMKGTSSLTNLAGKLYSNSSNKGYSTGMSASKVTPKNKSRPSSATHSNNPQVYNPSMILSKTMTTAIHGLSMRAAHVPSFAELNTELLRQKKQLQLRIKLLKQKIVHEKKQLNCAQYNCKKNRNQIDKEINFYNQAHNKSQRLEEQIEITSNDNGDLKKDLRNLRSKIQNRHKSINQEIIKCQKTQNSVKFLKVSLLNEEKERNYVKTDLGKGQRVMSSSSIFSKELQNQRAVMLLQINSSVNMNKL